jgi:hypothetical protein
MISEFFKVNGDDDHTYKWFGPTVSEIVRALNGSNYYDTVSDTVLQNATNRGVCVHKQLETSDLRCKCDPKDNKHNQIARAIDTLVTKWSDANHLEAAGRKIAFTTRYFVGTADLILKAKDAEYYSLCSYKTTYDPHLDSWKIQLALYYYGLFKLPKEDVKVIVFWAHKYGSQLKSEQYTITITPTELRDIVKRAKDYVKKEYKEYLLK